MTSHVQLWPDGSPRREHAPASQVDSDIVEGGRLAAERSVLRKGNIVRKQSSRGLRMEYSATRRHAVIVGGGWLRSTTEETKQATTIVLRGGE